MSRRALSAWSRPVVDRKRSWQSTRVDGDHQTRDQLAAELRACQAELAALRAAREERDDLAGTILDEMHQFVAILDVHGTTLRANHTSMAAVGSSPDSVLGRPFWEAPWWAVSPELRAEVRRLVERAAAGELVHTELRHFGGGGKELIDVDFTLKPVRDASGRVAYLIPEGGTSPRRSGPRRRSSARTPSSRACTSGSRSSISSRPSSSPTSATSCARRSRSSSAARELPRQPCGAPRCAPISG